MKIAATGLFLLLFNLSNYSISAQKLPSVQILQDSIKSSFRGLSVPSDNVVWVSGSNGTVGRSTDAGKTWQWMIVPGFEKRDFRDIEAFDSLTAIIMAVDNPANILKTTDGGESWRMEFNKEQKGIFLDALDCTSDTSCICIGDPIWTNEDSSIIKFYLVQSYEPERWGEILEDYDFEVSKQNEVRLPNAKKGESLFAASGSNIKIIDYLRKEYVFISGGLVSNLHIVKRGYNNNKIIKIPIIQGKPSTGAFSMHSDGKKQFYITGGDYNEYWKDSGNVVYTTNAGKTWKRSSVHGYRSCIIQADKKTFITCGTNGVDISFDGCKTWKLIHGDGAKGKDGFNVCAKSKTGNAVYFAGTGRIGKLVSN